MGAARGLEVGAAREIGVSAAKEIKVGDRANALAAGSICIVPTQGLQFYTNAVHPCLQMKGARNEHSRSEAQRVRSHTTGFAQVDCRALYLTLLVTNYVHGE